MWLLMEIIHSFLARLQACAAIDAYGMVCLAQGVLDSIQDIEVMCKHYHLASCTMFHVVQLLLPIVVRVRSL